MLHSRMVYMQVSELWRDSCFLVIYYMTGMQASAVAWVLEGVRHDVKVCSKDDEAAAMRSLADKIMHALRLGLELPNIKGSTSCNTALKTIN